MHGSKEWTPAEDREDGERRTVGDAGPRPRRMRAGALAIALTIAAAGTAVFVPPLDVLGAIGARQERPAQHPPAPAERPRASGGDGGAIASPPPTPRAMDASSAPLALEEQRATWRVSGGSQEAAALAVLVARRLARPGGQAPFVVLEAIERPAGDAVVVTVLLDDGARRPERLAVPIALGPEGARLAGEPWSLPAPVTEVLAPETTPVDDQRLVDAARRALEPLGLDASDVTLARTSSWPVIATARTGEGATTTVWLRWHLDRFVVAGLPLDRTGSVDATAGARP